MHGKATCIPIIYLSAQRIVWVIVDRFDSDFFLQLKILFVSDTFYTQQLIADCASVVGFFFDEFYSFENFDL